MESYFSTGSSGINAQSTALLQEPAIHFDAVAVTPGRVVMVEQGRCACGGAPTRRGWLHAANAGLGTGK
jgi:hypothetical protein